MDFKEVAKRVSVFGYAVMPRLDPELSTESIALKLGAIMDVSSFLPNIPRTQTLRPRNATERLMNQYSGTYGTEAFPLHSDLAHWYLPPRYLMLRCKVGMKDVQTTLVPYSIIASVVGEHTLKQALVAPRRKSVTQKICPLPVIFEHEGIWGLRWDFLFLSPLNEAARRAYDAIFALRWPSCDTIPVTLLEQGDTVVIDNWRMLHGRTAVPENSMGREIERIYLNQLGGKS